MSVWVNVRRWTTRGARVLALGASVSGCIDDFDDPKGYGGTDGRSRSSRGGCFEVCEKGAACNDELTCKRDCAELEAEIEAAGCIEEWEDLIECALELDSICADTDACEASVARFARCAST